LPELVQKANDLKNELHALDMKKKEVAAEAAREKEEAAAEAARAAKHLMEMATLEANAKEARETFKAEQHVLFHVETQRRAALKKLYEAEGCADGADQFAVNLHRMVLAGFQCQSIPMPEDVPEVFVVNEDSAECAWPASGENIVWTIGAPWRCRPTFNAVFFDMSWCHKKNQTKCGWPKKSYFGITRETVDVCQQISGDPSAITTRIFCSTDPRLVTVWCTAQGSDETREGFVDRHDLQILTKDKKVVHVAVLKKGVGKMSDEERETRTDEALQFFPEYYVTSKWRQIKCKEAHTDEYGTHMYILRDLV
jgi:hypothetical protein